MKRFPLLLIKASPVVNARYVLPSDTIEVTTAALAILSRRQLTAMVQHEMAHRELWHCQRATGIFWAGAVICLACAWSGDPWGATVALAYGWLGSVLSIFTQEFEADFVAGRRAGQEHLIAALVICCCGHPTRIVRWRIKALNLAMRWSDG